MPVGCQPILEDLSTETTNLLTLVDGAGESVWPTPTPAEGWTVLDQITHLAYFDEAITQAATDPEGFRAAQAAAMKDPAGFIDGLSRRHRQMAGAAALHWFRSARQRMVEVFAGIDPERRIPWYGPDMGPASAVTARLMETWAHGQDVFDALGRPHPSTPGLRHIAHLGVRTMGFSFRVRGLPVPDDPVAVVLRAPGREVWQWGPAGAANRVEGPAVDFCLLVTQRRHRDDTGLEAVGPVAEQWLRIAQAFAGPPGPGRAAGPGTADA